MRAVGYRAALPITDEAALLDITLPKPEPQGHDLLVEVRAISVNPVDTKVRRNSQPKDGGFKILGYDAAGIVSATGPDVTLFKAGDEVFYAGSILREGTNAEYHLVDERIVGRKPSSLNFAAAAALPLTSLTAWEVLFDRIGIERPVAGAAPTILIVGGAGGVGSIATQLVRQRTGLTVITTASRPETRDWSRQLGAHHVIDHAKPLGPQIEALGIGAPAFIFSTTQTAAHFPDLAALIAPQGRLGIIEAAAPLDIGLLKNKSVSLHWEMMFTRSEYQTADMQRQHEILNEVAALVDSGRVRTTLGEHFGTIDAANLKRAHALIESERARGKVVLEGFGAR